MPVRAFVDCHSHVVPSGDDGAASLAEGELLCREAARRGTRLLFATPHVWPHLPLTQAREEAIRATFAELAPRVELELRLGFELTPTRPLLDEDPRRFQMEGTSAVLIEVPFAGPLGLLLALAEHVEAAGLQPLIAHPERTEAVQAEPSSADALAERGWLLQVNATSLLGRHGPTAARIGWRLLEDGRATIVASDGHRELRPPQLDEAYAAAEERLGEGALRLFDGSALGLASSAGDGSRRAEPGSAVV